MFRLGVNTGFAINRYPEPEIWTSIVAEEFGIDVVQFTATLCDPFWPDGYALKLAENIRGLCDAKGIYLQTVFTDSWTRLGHITSPAPEIRRIWVNWFKRLADIGEIFGSEGIGSHFGILSFADNNDPARRREMMLEGCRNWAEIAEYAAGKGFKYVYFEPMSVPREFAGTLAETRELMELANRDIAIPMLLCLDVDHGDLESTDPDDTDPYRWLEEFAASSPVIHLKQSLLDKGGHYPFIAAYNERGKIIPEKVLGTLEKAGATDSTLILEFSHRERWPSDYTVIPDFKESIAYWREALAKYEAAGVSR